MGKDKGGFLTPKAISNRIKSKGLQKLRWYCQMCQKQCRDENGYKCHTSSEAHHRQMKIFMENGGKFISSFSSEFLKGYLDIVRRQFGGKRVHANVVYQEYIKDKEHVHMNATRWHSLTGLCLWLGKQGICRVDETEKGWFIEYIDRDPEAESRKASDARLVKTEGEINRRFLEKQIEKATSHKVVEDMHKEMKPLVRNDDDLVKLDLHLNTKRPLVEVFDKSRLVENKPLAKVTKLNEEQGDPKAFQEITDSKAQSKPISSTLNSPKSESVALRKKCPGYGDIEVPGQPQKIVNPLLLAEKKAKETKVHSTTMDSSKSPLSQPSSTLFSCAPKRSALDELMVEEEMLKEKRNRKDYWLTVGIEVKLIYRKLPRELLYRHAVVTDMEDDYTAVVQVLNSTKTKLRVDQDHVETVMPGVEEPLLVVNGAYRGEVAILKAINNSRCRVDIVIESGLCRGRVVKDVSMEDVCKVCDLSSI